MVQLKGATLLALSLSADAFIVNKRVLKPGSLIGPLMARDDKPTFFMEDTEDTKGTGKTTFISSVFKKELAFDPEKGRFFETGFGEGDCVPDEEFCITDPDSGSTLRLTIEEKERIFLDALQVSV